MGLRSSKAERLFRKQRGAGSTPVGASILLVLWASLAGAQTKYNPAWIEFDSVDHAATTSYRVEILPLVGEVPLAVWEVPKTTVQLVPESNPPRYRIPFSAVVALPVGTTYRLQLRGVNANNEPSTQVGLPGVSVDLFRFSSCVGGQTVAPMTIVQTGADPPKQVGVQATVRLTITSPEPVYTVSVDLVYDGGPAWYFQSTTDLRGEHPYLVGPFRRAQTSAVVFRAVDAAGCQSEAPGTWTIGR